jgi:protein-L-isoaspartate(D-aspartate) O-methyltransferase
MRAMIYQSMNESIPYESERRAMIENQLRRRGIRDARVLDAMFLVPRHEFVAPGLVRRAYDDRPLPIGQSETISQPYIVAAMTQASGIQPGDQVLEVGAGSGYQAAILSFLGARVFAVERNPDLAETSRLRLARLGFEGIQIITGDGTEGYPLAAPYQVIMVTAASPPQIPQPLLDQLAEGGRLVIPVGELDHQELRQVFKHRNEFATQTLDQCQFVPLIGKYGWPEKKS